MRGGFLWQAGCFAAGLLLVGSVGVVVLIWHLGTAFGLPSRGAGGVAILSLLVLIALVGTALAGRGIRRFAVPIGDLIDAAGRVRGGDYTTRIPEPRGGPPPVRSLVGAFNDMTARLDANEQQRRTLLADVSHELRTPLAVLEGELEAMLDGVHPADEAHLASALDETHVLARLVEDLRTLALAEAGTLALHREPTDLALLAEEVGRGFGPAADAAGVSIAVEVDDSLPLLDVDPLRLREVLANLVANALRYAPAGTTVLVAAGPDDDGANLHIRVTDAGPGIPPDLLSHVFERFSKAADSRGSGLGLAIARQLVEAHGGRIGVTSPPTGGTTMDVTLPVRPSP